jgi:hypothetical protein
VDDVASDLVFRDAWNGHCTPITWTKDPDAIIAKATNPQHPKIQIHY